MGKVLDPVHGSGPHDRDTTRWLGGADTPAMAVAVRCHQGRAAAHYFRVTPQRTSGSVSLGLDRRNYIPW